MKTKAELGQDIIDITMRIHKEFPELYKYIKEMPVMISQKDVINSTNLEDYHNSLVKMSEEYAKTHADAKDKTEQIN
jgi:hypothetical protein